MATYGEIVAEILQIVPMPGREDLIRSKVNQMIRYVAGTGDFHRALEEVTIGTVDGVDASARVQSIPHDSLFRSLLYVQYPEAISTEIIKVTDVKEVATLARCRNVTNIAYVSGGNIRIKHSELTSEFNLGYYVYPAYFATDGSDDAASNWITELLDSLIIDLTAAYMLNLNGDNEDSNRIQSMADLMSPSNIRAQVYATINTGG